MHTRRWATCTLFWLIGATSCALVAGCHSVAPSSTAALEQLLQPTASARESVVLEAYTIEVAAVQAPAVEAIWTTADEQFLTPEQRSALVANGLRAGIVGVSLPDELAKLLNPEGAAAPGDDPETSRVIDSAIASSPVGKRVEQLTPREEMPIPVGGLRDAVSVFLSAGSVTGRTFEKAQGAYTVMAHGEPGQRVVVRATPELQHGELRNRYSGRSEQGIFLMTPSREREIYSQLTVEANLAPGESLLLGGVRDAAGSLGDALHGSVGADERTGVTRLVLVRVAKVPDSEILPD